MSTYFTFKDITILKLRFRIQSTTANNFEICNIPCYLYNVYYSIFTVYLAKLVELLEVLASHSISSVELKTFLHLLSPDKDQQLPGYAHMMQRMLLNVALKDTRNLPLHSIDLTATESVSHNNALLQIIYSRMI